MLTDEAGLSQRQVATRTGQSQSEVADIIAGRKVESHSLLRRIVQGLDIPPELMGLSWWAADGTYCGEVTVAELPEGVSAEMLRRHLLALGATAAFGAQIKGLGELLDVGTPTPAPLPSQLFGVHVVQVREQTRSLHEAIHAHGSQPQVSSAATVWADRLLKVPPNHDRRTIAEACVQATAATTLARMGKTQAAATELAKSRELWQPARTDPWGDPDGAAACLEIERGRLDLAESLAAASVRRWENGSRLSRTLSGIVLATIHVKAGEPSGLSLAHRVITSVAKLSSMRARTRLTPLAAELAARPGPDARELARMTRQVATSQA